MIGTAQKVHLTFSGTIYHDKLYFTRTAISKIIVSENKRLSHSTFNNNNNNKFY